MKKHEMLYEHSNQVKYENISKMQNLGFGWKPIFLNLFPYFLVFYTNACNVYLGFKMAFFIV